MDPDNRDWGRGSLVDYVPFLGVVYRFYWCFVARRGARKGRRSDWMAAFRNEAVRLFLASVVTGSVVVFVVLGGTDGGLEPALLVVVAGFFIHRVVALITSAGA